MENEKYLIALKNDDSYSYVSTIYFYSVDYTDLENNAINFVSKENAIGVMNFLSKLDSTKDYKIIKITIKLEEVI